MADEIQMQTLTRQLPTARQEIASGDSVRFGAVSLSAEGIRIEKKEVSFDSMKALSIVNGTLVVCGRGDEKYAAMSEVANSLVFLKQLEESPAPEVRLGR
jgi:hypothetical protein